MTVPANINPSNIPVYDHEGYHNIAYPTYFVRELYRNTYAKIFITNAKNDNQHVAWYKIYFDQNRKYVHINYEAMYLDNMTPLY